MDLDRYILTHIMFKTPQNTDDTMFPGEEWVTVASSLTLLVVSLAIARRSPIPGILWVVSALGFLFVSLGLAVWGLGALEIAATPVIGALYPGFLATGILAWRFRVWRYYLAFTLAMLALMAAGIAIGYRPLAGASQGVLHSLSGLIIVLAPIYYAVRGLAPGYSILVSLGGLLISVGGLALAAIAVGSPILPLELVVFILHPILFLSALIMASGLYLSWLRG